MYNSPMSDGGTTIQQLKQLVRKFRDDRDWKQFHDPKNLAEALTIESSELLEHFLWNDKLQIANKLKSSKSFRGEIGDELADVFGYCLHLSDALGIDLSKVLKKKYAKNAMKYPIEKSKGNNTKYTRL